MDSLTWVRVSAIAHEPWPAVADHLPGNDWGPASINITQVGDFTEAPYAYTLTPLRQVQKVVTARAGVGKVKV